LPLFAVCFLQKRNIDFTHELNRLPFSLHEIKQVYDDIAFFVHIYCPDLVAVWITKTGFLDWMLDTFDTLRTILFLIAIQSVALSPIHNYSLQYCRYYTQPVCSSPCKHWVLSVCCPSPVLWYRLPTSDVPLYDFGCSVSPYVLMPSPLWACSPTIQIPYRLSVVRPLWLEFGSVVCVP
jgi:hypothetical protein